MLKSIIIETAEVCATTNPSILQGEKQNVFSHRQNCPTQRFLNHELLGMGSVNSISRGSLSIALSRPFSVCSLLFGICNERKQISFPQPRELPDSEVSQSRIVGYVICEFDFSRCLIDLSSPFHPFSPFLGTFAM